MRYLCIIMFLFLQVENTYAQSAGESFFKLSCPEKWWAFTHPFVAHKAFKLSMEARKTAREMMNDSALDHDWNGGQVDAFRHTYWMALLSQQFAARKARKLGIAHEKVDYIAFKKNRKEDDSMNLQSNGELPDSMASVMDLCNNESGIELGSTHKNMTKEELRQAVKAKVLAGELKVLKKDKQKHCLNCDGAVIDIQLYIHRWNIPKCLVKSDENKY
jgi:hypothetical protein